MNLGLSNSHLVPGLLGIIFLLAISVFLFKKFRVPGIFFSSGMVFGLINVSAIYFQLGSSLSLVSISGFIAGLFFAFFLSFYILSFLKQLFDIEFLDKDNIKVIFKRGLVFASDLSLPVFIFSTLIAFLGPINLREFGIVLSLCVITYFIIIPLLFSHISLEYVKNNFLKISNFYKSIKKTQSFFLKKCTEKINNNKLFIGLIIFLGLLLLSIVFYTTMGFNSFSLFKSNYLLTVESNNGNVGNVQDNGNWKKLTNESGFITFIAKTLESAQQLQQQLQQQLKPESQTSSKVIFQETNSYDDVSTAIDLGKVLIYSFLLICVYILIRFKAKNCLILLLNTLISFFFLFSIFTITRIPLYSKVFLSICLFFFAIITYHIFLFNMARNNEILDWFKRLSSNILSDFYSGMKTIIFLFLSLSLFAIKENIVISHLYTFVSLITTHYLSTFLYFVFTDKWTYLNNKYIWKRDISYSDYQEDEDTNNLDNFDEELIAGINKNY